MSAQPVPVTGPSGSPQDAPSFEHGRLPGEPSSARAVAKSMLNDAPESLPLPSSKLALWSLAAYAIITILSGGVASVGLAGLPLVAAAILPRARGLVYTAATVAVTLVPLFIRPATQVMVVATLAELGILLIAAVAVRASIVRLVRARGALFAQARTTAAQMAVIQAASARMNRQGSVESVGRAIVEETGRIIEYHNARVYLLEPPDDLVPIAFEGTVGAYEKVDFAVLRTKLGLGFTGWVAQHGEPMLIRDANADPRGSTIPGTDDVDESMLVVPMRYDERIVGTITLSKLGLNQFDAEDLRLLTILADQAATALESVRLLARSQDLAIELRRLLDMSSDLANSLEPRTVADLIARHVAGAMGVEQCAISYYDRPNDRLLTWGFFPRPAPAGGQDEYQLADFPETRRVLDQQVPLAIDVHDPGADRAETALLREEGYETVVLVPLVAKGESIGLVEILSATSFQLTDGQVELARTMANEAAMALENARLYEDTRKLADHDPLTGFYNHRFLHERLGEEIVRAQRSGTALSLLMLDLDDFKLVNDTFGHLFGDRVLAWAAELIRSTLRASDVPARYGGDEFAVILPETGPTAANVVAERMLAAFQTRPYESEGRGGVPIAASIGIAGLTRDGRSAQELIAAADAALYRVKNAGGHGAALPSGPVHEHDGRRRLGYRPGRASRVLAVVPEGPGLDEEAR
jgi:diguanylate cyclase (GGDEF)-like protein